MWAIGSGCSGQMSDCERIAQVTHDKWTTVSELLRSLFCSQKMSDLLKFYWLKSYFVVRFLRAIHSFPFFNERCEQSAQFAHQKWAMWTNRSGRSSNEQIARFFEQMSDALIFSQKKSNLLRKIRKTIIEFPTMGRIDLFLYRASTMTIWRIGWNAPGEKC